jgi:Insertion element 4 transposase N-terminal/Transposase DDE domain
MAHRADNDVVAGGRLTDQVTFGVLAASVPRDAVDDAVAAAGKQARRRDGKLPPHVMVYFAMAMALFADEDYEEVAARLAGTLASWRCWDDSWSVPTSGGITQARQRLGYEPLAGLFAAVAQPVAGLLTRGAFLAGWRLMAVDGFEWDVPDTPANAAEFGYAGRNAGDPARPAFPKVRVVTVSECGSHAVVDAAIGGVAGKGAGEQSLARGLYPRLADDWLLLADRNFYNWQDWCAAADTGAALLWRVKADLSLPVLEILPDGSYLSVLFSPKVKGTARQAVTEAARAGGDLDEDQARYVRVVEYQVPDRNGDGKGELIALITTITGWEQAPAAVLAEAYAQRWEHETGNDQLKTHLRGPGRVLRSRSPDMVRQEIYGYLLTHHALSTLICQAATEADIDPDRVKFTRTVRIVRRAIAPAAFPPSAP